LDQEKGEWMAKVPISGATKAVWQRYCQAVGVRMGEGVALLMLHELASIVDEEDVETLADRLIAREAEMNAKAQELKDRDKELKQRDRTLFLREADLEGREREVTAREENVAAVEQSLARRLEASPRVQPVGRPKRKLGRNDPCWCGSGKKYKFCHGVS
jgi:uncharacterized protein YecA (UPF0149 family)